MTQESHFNPSEIGCSALPKGTHKEGYLLLAKRHALSSSLSGFKKRYVALNGAVLSVSKTKGSEVRHH